MKKWMIIVLVILIVIITLYFYLKEIYKTLIYKPFFEDLDLSNITSSSFFQGESFARISVGFMVKYFGFIDFTIYNLVMQAYYNGILIAKTSNIPANAKPIHLKNNFENIIYQTFDAYVNGNTFALAYKIKTKEVYSINYVVSFKILGIIPIQYKGIYTSKPKAI